ncbi:1-acyl-sn-glycerol-3-phosphate acyltransferase [Granulicella aggregans]|uniref:1-acyl-sn-glycerol-3-phosphate acyltransferase n=1 Tax=Granulicella aggregans TaxID=474949 RepID=A0A7W8E220_9BACT|nr:lysophospholipid acyltransferase family protein [Granulicella aggregans]MBB5055891.1 1-acyl-sn-glycerol-3-phosphate acyltransferase [Granulicella aggregans]
MFAAFKMLFVYLVFGGIAGVLGVPYSFLIHDIGPLYRLAMRIMHAGVVAGGIRVEVVGRENLPVDRSCIFMSNHVSNLDPPVLMPSLPGRSSILLKKSLMGIPILGTAMRMAKFVPVERGHSVEAAKTSIAAAASALRSGLNIIVFPEGTRSRDGRLKAFKKGPFFLAEDTKAPIVPIAISGTQDMMRKGSFAITPGVARVEFLKAIEPGEYASRDELMAAVRGAIDAALPLEMKAV